MSRPKDIGTAAETAVVRWARARGFGGADPTSGARRVSLAGALDEGDVLLCPGVVVEVKSGKAAEQASDAQVSAWLAEAEVERRNAGAAVAFLVRKRRGYGPARAGAWHAHLTVSTLLQLDGAIAHTTCLQQRKHYGDTPLHLTLDDALVILRAAGYGDDL